MISAAALGLLWALLSGTKAEGHLVATLLQHYHSTCTALILPGTPIDLAVLQVAKLRRDLSVRGITTVVLDYDEYLRYQHTVWCTSSRPLNVILTANERTGHFLQKIRGLSRSRWLLTLDTTTIYKDASAVLRDVHVPFDCEFIVATRVGSEFRLTEVYRVAGGLPLRSQHCGKWSEEAGLCGLPRSRLLCRRGDLEGLQLHGVTANSSSTEVYTDKNNALNLSGGFFGSAWKLLEERINFTTTFTTPTDGAWGSLEENSSWNGMIGMTQRSEVQAAVAMFTMTPQRHQVVDFTIPLVSMKYALYIRQTQSVEPNWKSFAAPFSRALWLTVLTTITVMAACLVYRLGVSDSLLILSAIFTQRAPHLTPKQTSRRVVVLAVQLTALVLMAAYSATLVSFLAVSRTSPPFRTLRELLEDGSYQLGLIAKSAEYDYFAKGTNELTRLVWQHLIKPQPENIVATEMDGLNRACDERYAFMSSSYFTTPYRQHSNCSLMEIPIDMFQATFSMVLAKGSPYTGIVNYNLQKLRRFGLLNRLRSVHSHKTRISESSQSPLQINLKQFMPVLVILLAGVVLSLVFLGLENRQR